MLNPHVQARAQDEVDRVVGKSRLPSIGDKDDLPYVNAVLKEVLRWAPAAPLAISHRLTQDDTYAGFYIPRGTTIIPNIWFVFVS
jgi:cytochrome P450